MLAAFVADRIHARAGSFVVLPLAVALGTASLVYWHIGEAAGRGDLRFYFLTQAFAFVLIPLICVLFRARNTNGRYVLYILLLYGLGVACDSMSAFSGAETQVFWAQPATGFAGCADEAR